MKISMLSKHTALCTVLVLIAGCSTSSPNNELSATASNDLKTRLASTEWTLSQYESDDGIRITFDRELGARFTINFTTVPDSGSNADGKVSGVIVCNGYSGDYSLEQEVLSTTQTFATEIACELSEEPPAALFERVLFSQNNASVVSFVDGNLELTSGSNETLIFTDALSVEFSLLVSGDLAFTQDLTFDQPRFQVIQSNEELNALYSGSLVDPSCESCGIVPLTVDFSVNTVVLVAHEIVGSGGYGFDIESIRLDNENPIVNIVKTTPGNNCAVTTAFTGPYALYVLTGNYDDAEFIERTVQNAAC